MKKLITGFIIALLAILPLVNAEVVIDNSTYEILENAEVSCFKNSKYGLWDTIFYFRNGTDCPILNGSYPYGVPSYCQDFVEIWNPTGEAIPVVIQAIPLLDDLSCPAPQYTNIVARVRMNHFNTNHQTDFASLDLNECWEWWCEAEVTQNITECPFGWNALRWLGPLGGCQVVNTTIKNSIEQCPFILFNIQPDDYKVRISWSYRQSPDNDVDPPMIIKIKGYVTDYTSTILVTEDNKTLATGVSNYITGMETILTTNMSLLGIIYLIFEIVAIIIAIIGIPTLVVLLIKWVWETIVGTKMGWRQRGGR